MTGILLIGLHPARARLPSQEVSGSPVSAEVKAMRGRLAALLLVVAAAVPVAACADSVDVMTVSGGGQTWTFDFPAVETFDYSLGLAQFVPGLTPVSETVNGVSVTPTELFFHPGGMNMTGPFGTLMYINVLDVLSSSGPFVDAQFPGGYDQYTSTFYTGTFTGYGVTFNGTGPVTTDFSVSIQQVSAAAAPELSGLALLGTGVLGLVGVVKRRVVGA